MMKLDPEILSLLAKKKLHERNPDEPAYQIDSDLKVHISVQFSGPVSGIEIAGFKPTNAYEQIAHGKATLEQIEALSTNLNVIRIQIQSDYVVQLDDSIPDIMANNVWSRSGDNFSGYTGRGVIVGIIDTGIDFRHKNFISPGGQTRILKIWDQTIINPINPPQGGESAPAAITTGPFQAALGYGVEYDGAMINDTLNNASPAIRVRHVDNNGHGTHVAGIAAGNGKQAGGCHGEHHYIGVAPEANLVIVRMWGLSDGDRGQNMTPPANPPVGAPSSSLVGDALRYIMNEALNQSMPVVINCSFGSFSHVMDGTDSDCTTVNNLLTANPNGRAVVWAAGNDGDSGFHATGTVPASGGTPVELLLKIYRQDTKTRSVVIVYTGSNLEPQVISPVGGANGTVSWVTIAASPGSSTTANGAGGTVNVQNLPNIIVVTITPLAATATTPAGNNVASTDTTDWKIQLRNTTSTPTAFNAFCNGGSSHDRKSPKFQNLTTTNSTLTSEATGRDMITVGSYEVGGQLAGSSGRGPTLDGRTKPELCAPGVGITSTGIPKDREGDTCANCCCQSCQDWYVSKGGTSMAAPHIAGVVALMLHKNPGLSHTQIKTGLTTNVNGPPGDAPPSDAVGWGAGKVSALNSVSSTTQVNAPVAMVASPAIAKPSLIQQFLQTEYGNIYYDLAHRYFHELLHLVNNNKRVATAWHRSNGPVWVRQALTAFNNPEAEVPTSANGVSFIECVEQFVQVILKYGSDELKADILRCKAHVSLVREGLTLKELMVTLGNRPLEARQLYADSVL